MFYFSFDFVRIGSQLKIVSSMSSGVDHIDQAELKARNISLANTPYVLNDAVADVAILLMLGAIRRLPERLTEIKRSILKGNNEYLHLA